MLSEHIYELNEHEKRHEEWYNKHIELQNKLHKIIVTYIDKFIEKDMNPQVEVNNIIDSILHDLQADYELRLETVDTVRKILKEVLEEKGIIEPSSEHIIDPKESYIK